MAVAEKLKRHADGSARAFVQLFSQELWEPFEKAGHPEHDWQRMSEALERLRPLAAGHGAGDVQDRDGRGGREGERADPAARPPANGERAAATKRIGSPA